jgi:hypothetical protein
MTRGNGGRNVKSATLDYDSIALAVLMIALGFVGLLVFRLLNLALTALRQAPVRYPMLSERPINHAF